MKQIRVAAAVLICNGRLLISQRKPDANQPLKWEFPGGKIEPGETPGEALERELKEELGISTRSGECLCEKTFEYPEKTVHLLFLKSCLLAGAPRAIDCSAFRWVRPGEICNYDFAGADLDMAKRLSRARFEGDLLVEDEH